MKAKCSLQFQDTLHACDMTYEEWQYHARLAQQHHIPGVRVARRLIARIHQLHTLRLQVQSLQRRLA
jgi:hypothetical protein